MLVLGVCALPAVGAATACTDVGGILEPGPFLDNSCEKLASEVVASSPLASMHSTLAVSF